MLTITNKIEDETCAYQDLKKGELFILIGMGHICRVLDDSNDAYNMHINKVIKVNPQERVLVIDAELILYKTK